MSSTTYSNSRGNITRNLLAAFVVLAFGLLSETKPGLALRSEPVAYADSKYVKMTAAVK